MRLHAALQHAPLRAVSTPPPLTLRRADMDASGDAARNADAAAADAVRFL
jgi:hypothetical protein